MWFTQVSLKNPVFATMVMLAVVVLGMFSYQRLSVDLFPNIDLPVASDFIFTLPAGRPFTASAKGMSQVTCPQMVLGVPCVIDNALRE